jgi:galactose mutarotase-like enzyme
MQSISVLLIAIQLMYSFAFTNKQHMVIVPYTFTHDHIYVRLKVNNSDSLDFLFDPGWHAQGILADSSIASSSGFAMADSVQLIMKTLVIPNQRVSWTSLKSLQAQMGHHVDGVLGNDFAETFVVRIDPAHHRLIITDPHYFMDRNLKGKTPIKGPMVDFCSPVKKGRTVTLNLAQGYMIVSD